MGISVASLNPISSVAYVTANQQAYSISGESAVSQSYRDSIKNTATPAGVRATAPVTYSNTRFDISAIQIQNLNDNQKLNRGLNAIASSFGGASTSYGRDMSASPYDMFGSGFDAFA